MSSRFDVEIVKLDTARIPRQQIHRVTTLCRRILKRRALWPSELTQVQIVLVSSNHMKSLNRRFRHKNKPTDVLSFAPTQPNSLGEIVLCLDVLRRQARDFGVSLSQELRIMLVHGILHRLGFDHESEADARCMFQLQERVVAEIDKLM